MKSFSELPEYCDVRKLWKQEPVEPPSSDLELTENSWVERGAEVIGWQLAKLEHWLSQSGWLRAWFRTNLFLAIVLTITGVLLLPPVSQVLELFSESSHSIAEIILDLVSVISGVPPVILSLALIYLSVVALRKVRRFRQRRSRGLQPSSEEDGYFQ